jgi:hypothetical protein
MPSLRSVSLVARTKPLLRRVALACALLTGWVGVVSAISFVESTDFPGGASLSNPSVGTLENGANTIAGKLAGNCDVGDCNPGTVAAGDTADSFTVTVPDGYRVSTLTVSTSNVSGPTNFSASLEIRGPNGLSPTAVFVPFLSPLNGTTANLLTTPLGSGVYVMSVYGQQATVAGPYSLDWQIDATLEPVANTPYGTAARAARHGDLSADTDIVGGDVNVGSIARYAGSSDGSQAGRASIGPSCSPLPQWSKDCLRAGVWSGSFSGIARAIVFKTFRYTGSTAKSGRINATLDGEFLNAPFGLPNGFLGVGGSVRVLDPAGFAQRLAQAGMPAGQFMLSDYSITDGLQLDQLFANTNSLFSASLLASGRDFLSASSSPAETPLSIGIKTSTFLMQPGQYYTVMFDVASYSAAIRFADGTTGNGDVNFLDTLSADPALFTDESGNPITDIEAVGPAGTEAPSLSSLALAPASSSGQVDSTQTFTATLLATGDVPVPDTLVHFEVIGGPDTGVVGIGQTDAQGHAAFSYAGTQGAGIDVVRASVGALQSNEAQMLWQLPGDLDHIVLSPHAASIAVNTSQPFTVEAFDRFNASRGDVTGSTTLSIAPDGSCSGASCTASTVGDHVVTATYEQKTDQATITFTAPTGYSFTGFLAPIDDLPIVNSAKAGSAVPVKFSLHGNQGLDIFAAGFPASQATACSAGSTEAVVEQTASAGASGLTYDPASDQYNYVWKTEKGWAGQCRLLSVKLADGSVHSALFKFK